MSIKYFTIKLPTDEGFFGQKCPEETCGKYFKVHQDHIGEILYCPYCGTELKDKELFTAEQQKYIEKEAERVITDYAAKEFDKMLSNAFRGNKYITVTSSSQRPVFRTSSIKEHKVDSEIECPDCHTRFQVYGIFGYCPNCHTENILIYDANLQIIRNEVLSSSDQYRALRHAYDDLVSTFETFCSHVSQKNGLPESKFQNIFETRKYFKDSVLKIDILNGLSDQEILTLRRVFQKRHVNIHDKGIINKKYVQFIPEDQKLLGSKVSLTLEEFENAAQALKTVILNLI
jgi:hypothetical protein